MTTRQVTPDQRVVLMVGTTKAAFLFTSDLSRRKWQLHGPYLTGDSSTFHMAYDARDDCILAGVNRVVWGPEVQRTYDLGDTWSASRKEPRFTAGGGDTVKRVWHLEPGRSWEPGVLYAGVEPAALFKSEDNGETWQEMKTLTAHPSRSQWTPGNGGLCLHSIVLDPQQRGRMYVGISSVGVFRTDDSGESWRTMNRGVHAFYAPDPLPEFGQCVHKMYVAPGQANRLYQQNHCGVYRTDSAGDAWDDISEGLPSRFGFVLGLHPRDPKTLFVVPEDRALGTEMGGYNRVVTDDRMRVYRSRDAGASWQAKTKGLPQDNAFLHLLREGMAVDSCDPCGVYFGTTTGQLYYSRDEGESWELLADHLPPINSVGVGVRG